VVDVVLFPSSIDKVEAACWTLGRDVGHIEFVVVCRWSVVAVASLSVRLADVCVDKVKFSDLCKSQHRSLVTTTLMIMMIMVLVVVTTTTTTTSTPQPQLPTTTTKTTNNNNSNGGRAVTVVTIIVTAV